MKNLLKTGLIAVFGLSTFSVVAQCEGFDKHPEGEKNAKLKHVSYRDYVKEKDFEKAYPIWEDLMKNSPAGSEFHYVDGIKMIKAQYKASEDEAAKLALGKRLMDLYDGRVECFGSKVSKKTGKAQRNRLLTTKAYDMYYVLKKMDKETAGLIKTLASEQGNATDHRILYPLASTTVALFRAKTIEAEEARNAHKLIMDILDHQLANTTDEKKLGKINSTRDKSQKKFEGIDKWIFDCAYFKSKLEPEYRADPDNAETYRRIYKELAKRGCGEDDPLLKEIASKDKGRLAANKAAAIEDFKANNPGIMAGKAYKEGRHDDACRLYDEAAAAAGDPSEKFKYKMRKATIQYAKMKRFSEARSTAREAAALMPSSGKPYILIGRMYASSGPRCGSGRGWKSQVVVWPAMDMWYKAKNLDPNVASEADELIAKYRKYMPTEEDVFQRSLKDGGSYSVGCWIGATTTIRARKQY